MRRGRITKQRSTLLRWALTEAVQNAPPGTPMRQVRERLDARRGASMRNIGKIAAARKLLTPVYHTLRDGHVRCLQQCATPG